MTSALTASLFSPKAMFYHEGTYLLVITIVVFVILFGILWIYSGEDKSIYKILLTAFFAFLLSTPIFIGNTMAIHEWGDEYVPQYKAQHQIVTTGTLARLGTSNSDKTVVVVEAADGKLVQRRVKKPSVLKVGDTVKLYTVYEPVDSKEGKQRISDDSYLELVKLGNQ